VEGVEEGVEQGASCERVSRARRVSCTSWRWCTLWWTPTCGWCGNHFVSSLRQVFIEKPRSFYQDRLRTIVGNSKKGTVLMRGKVSFFLAGGTFST
jgi:hypothetical protein